MLLCGPIFRPRFNYHSRSLIWSPVEPVDSGLARPFSEQALRTNYRLYQAATMIFICPEIKKDPS